MKGQHVFLCGFMGVGKTTVAEILAAQLGWPWMDTDTLIKNQRKQSISEIFKKEGEAAFRQYETEVLNAIKPQPAAVVSLGGGILNNPANFNCIHEKGVLVFLSAGLENILQRLRPSLHERPLLAGLSEVQLRDKVQAMIKERAPQYSQARWTITTDGKSAEQVAQEIKKLVEETFS